jgi:hypothetical protein
MRKNISPADRIIRVMIAAIAAFLFLGNHVTGIAGIAMMAVGAYALVTGAINFCPVYYLLGISSFEKKEEA